jgi:hypothetical protein
METLGIELIQPLPSLEPLRVNLRQVFGDFPETVATDKAVDGGVVELDSKPRLICACRFCFDSDVHCYSTRQTRIFPSSILVMNLAGEKR